MEPTGIILRVIHPETDSGFAGLMSDLFPIQCPDLGTGNANIVHGFFTRQGGVSGGCHESLNARLSSTDDLKNIQKNRENIAHHLGLKADDLVTAWQCHSSDVAIACKNWGNNRPKVDGIVTGRPGLAIAVLTADCGPVLFCDSKAGVIGATHAGWRGAISGILETTIEKMVELGATHENIYATLGPTISRENYETGPEFIEKLTAIDCSNIRYFSPSSNSGHACFDLPCYIVDRLVNLGIKAQWTGHCTYADKTRFFSYRRSVHQKEGDYGAQMSVITIPDF